MGGKHWKLSEDLFLAAYYSNGGDFIGRHDLGRKKGAATQRVAFLKKTGAWDVLLKMEETSVEYARATHTLQAEYVRLISGKAT